MEKAIISEINPQSPADQAGLKPQDIVISLNETKLVDIIDFYLLTDEPELDFIIEREGNLIDIRLKKEFGQPTGIKFRSSIFDSIKICQNKCLFCFVDQLPSGVRTPLLLKDDDYRLSFLYGNFITLTNLTENDISRIIDLKLSPLYVSLHSTEPKIRKKLFGRKSEQALSNLSALLDGGIEIHIQIVLCPGINDNIHLWKTLEKLSADFDLISSVGIVPVGITRFNNNKEVRLFSRKAMKITTNDIESSKYDRVGKNFAKKIMLADEFFLESGLNIPSEEYYLDFCQIENGIGMTRFFLINIEKEKENLVLKNDIGIITGKLFYPIMKQIIKKSFAKSERVRVYSVNNNFFGSTVTVAGLLTGNDIKKKLQDDDWPSFLFLPKAVLSSNLFLDDLSQNDLENRLNKKIIYLDNYGRDFYQKIMEVAG